MTTKNFDERVQEQELEGKLKEQKESQKKYFLDFYKMERSYNEIKNKYIKTCIQNKRYREALEFYADRDNYKPDHYDPDIHDYMSAIDYDEGAVARQALEGEEIE